MKIVIEWGQEFEDWSDLMKKQMPLFAIQKTIYNINRLDIEKEFHRKCEIVENISKPKKCGYQKI